MTTKLESSKTYYTTTEVAERWQMSERHVRREIAAGILPAHRFGRTVRISATDLAMYEARFRGVVS